MYSEETAESYLQNKKLEAAALGNKEFIDGVISFVRSYCPRDLSLITVNGINLGEDAGEDSFNLYGSIETKKHGVFGDKKIKGDFQITGVNNPYLKIFNQTGRTVIEASLLKEALADKGDLRSLLSSSDGKLREYSIARDDFVKIGKLPGDEYSNGVELTYIDADLIAKAILKRGLVDPVKTEIRYEDNFDTTDKPLKDIILTQTEKKDATGKSDSK